MKKFLESHNSYKHKHAHKKKKKKTTLVCVCVCICGARLCVQYNRLAEEKETIVERES